MQKKSLIKSRAAAKKALLASKKTKLGAANKGTKISANAMTENSLSYSAASTRAGLQANAVNSSAAINQSASLATSAAASGSLASSATNASNAGLSAATLNGSAINNLSLSASNFNQGGLSASSISASATNTSKI
jgi:hypothetical protein